MNKKLMSLATVCLFTFFTISCTYTKMVKVEPGADYEKGKIVGVVKTTGEKIDFPKRKSGFIIGTEVQIKKGKTNNVELKRKDIKQIVRSHEGTGEGKIISITTFDGQMHFPILVINQDAEKIFFTSSEFETFSIPLSNVKFLKIQRSNLVGTLLGGLALLLLSSIIIWVHLVNYVNGE